MNLSANKAPLCRFINSCRDYKSTGNCKFRHDKCRDADRCMNKSSCKFYHPELSMEPGQAPAQNRQKRDLKSIPCNFGDKCNKRLQGTCPYMHEPTSTANPPKSKVFTTDKSETLCKFGPTCNKFERGLCGFKHELGQSAQGSQNNGGTSSDTMGGPEQRVVDNTNYNEQFEEFERSKVCGNFVMGKCTNGFCEQAHQFTIDNSIKRVYCRQILGNTPPRCRMLSIGQTRVFVLALEGKISFYQLDEQSETLKAVKDMSIAVGRPIVSLQTCRNESSAAILFGTQEGASGLFLPLKGQLVSPVNQINGPIVGCQFFPDPATLVAAKSGSGLYVHRNAGVEAKLGQANMQNITVMKRFEMLGEKFLMVGARGGEVWVLNRNLEPKQLTIQNSSIIDIQCCIVSEKPFAFVAGERKTPTGRACFQVEAVNLLDFAAETVLTLENDRICGIACLFDKLFVAVEGVGVLVYVLPDLRRVRGRIPLLGAPITLQADAEGFLLVVEVGGGGRSTVSAYRVRK